MPLSWNMVALEGLGVLRLRGADAGRFLQGQLSNDMTRLSPERALLAGFHNAQGRAIALLRLVQLAPDDVLAVLPRELVDTVATRLGKFVLRARVRLEDDSQQWRIAGALAGAGAAAALPVLRDAVCVLGDARVVRLSEGAARLLVLQPLTAAALREPVAPLSLADWQLAAIAAGEPQVYAATSEEFVAQMLNLDLIDAIAFDKGCYTGQEVIARSHYRGRVKRRLQRFLASASAALRPGDAGTFTDGRTFRVVEAARRADGSLEFLAVTALEPDSAAVATAQALPVTPLALPYALPQ